MTILRAITPRNVLVFLCVVFVVLIGIKGFYIIQKISLMNEADRLYASKDLVAAEEWYLKAKNNKWIRYKENELDARLQTLAPITEIKQKLLEITEGAQRSEERHDFEKFMIAYDKLQGLHKVYAEPKNAYTHYYRQLSESYHISEQMKHHFEQFIVYFDSQMKANLENKKYENESFKANLLRIPAIYFGGDKKQTKQLNAKFKAYDESKMAQLAAAGNFQALLDDSLAMIKSYKQLGLKARWVRTQVESLASAKLHQDAEQKDYASFASHAGKYTAFLQTEGWTSKVEVYIRSQIRKWMKEAKSLVAQAQYQEAIARYEALAAYHDTKAEIEAANLAWAKAEPLRLLQSTQGASQNYDHIRGGSNHFGAKVYVVASDNMNRLYYGTWNMDNKVEVMTGEAPKSIKIRSIDIEEQLSTKEHPVLRVEADSDTRTAIYAAYEARNGQLQPLFQFEADGYQVNSDGTISVMNPNLQGAEGGVAIYQRVGDVFQFTGVQQPTTDISVENLLQYADRKVRFTCNIVSVSENGSFASMGEGFVQLKGNFPFQLGTVTVVGTFHESVDTQINDQLYSTPVFEVESLEY